MRRKPWMLIPSSPNIYHSNCLKEYLLHPEQMHSNPPEKTAATTMSSGGSFDTVSSSGFPGDARVQGVPLAGTGPRPGISSNNMVRCLFYVTVSHSHVCWMPRGAGPSLSSGPNTYSV